MASTSLSAFEDTIKNFDRASFPNEDERQRAIYAARDLVLRLERPYDTLINYTWIIPGICFATRVCLNMGLFHKMEEDGGAPRPVAQLAKSVNADPVLVDRLLKHLSACRLVAETESGVYGPTMYTSELTKRATGSTLDFLYDMVWPTMLKSPEFLEQTSYQHPTDVLNGPWQYTMNCPDTPFFGWLGANPKAHMNFVDLMSGYTADRENWTQVYPTEQIVASKTINGATTNGTTTNGTTTNGTATNGHVPEKEILLIDLGGNIGSDLERFLNKHPEAAGHVVLQDQPEVVKNAVKNDGIVATAHDFFTPQPLRPNYFFMHSILHDWSDADCLRILENLKPAFIEKPGTKLLLSENVIPASKAHPQTTAMDLIMLTHTGSQERTELMWTTLLETAGFRITKIYPGRIESVIEAQLI